MNVTNSIHNRNLNKIPPDTTSKKPWGVYLADNYMAVNATSGYIPDSGSNNRSAATTTNVTKIDQAINFKVPVLAGDVTAKIEFPAGSLPPTYTILSVTRYSSSNRNRIIVSPNINFTHSHYENGNAKFYNDGTQITSVAPTQPNQRSVDSWCISISTNSTAVPIEYAAGINNTYIGVLKAGSTAANVALGINNSHFGNGGGENQALFLDKSDFQFYALVIYDQGLTVTEMTNLSTKYINFMQNPAI